jgi:rubrerythrin
VDYPADRMLQAAEEMERRVKMFYESFAAVCGNSRITALAASLANAEQKHISLFRQMRESLPPDRQLTQEQIAGAARELFNDVIPDKDSVRQAVLASDLCGALDMAVAMEMRTAAFYEDLVFRLGGHCAAAVALLVNEEKEHVRMLRELRERLLTPSGKNVGCPAAYF